MLVMDSHPLWDTDLNCRSALAERARIGHPVRVGPRSIRLAAFAVVLIGGLFASAGDWSSVPIGSRTERYHGVEVSIPSALVRVRHATYISDCDALGYAGVYTGQLDLGKCAIGLDPNLLSVTLSPLDAYTTDLSTEHQAFVSMKIVRRAGVAVGVWYGSQRAADAARILASVRQVS